MINKKIKSKFIESPLSKEYIRLSIDGMDEIKNIMAGYARAAHEARDILIT